MLKNKCKIISILLMLIMVLQNIIPSIGYAERRYEQQKSLVLLNVVKAWDSPNQLNWEYHAPIKSTNEYQLYEATIWSDHVSLYKFDENFGNDELTPAYRESFLVKAFPIDGEVGSEEASKSLSNAFMSFFDIIVDNSPSIHYGIKYTGHGSGPGNMFANSIQGGDTQQLLSYMKNRLGRKIDFYDMGTNCNQASVAILNTLYPYFEYVIASELAVGGYKMDQENHGRYKEAYDFYQYPSIFATNEALETKLTKVLKLARKRWVLSKKNMTASKYKQSISLFKMDAYEPLMRAVKTNKNTKNVDIATLNNSLKLLIQKTKNKELLAKYNQLVIQRENNGDFFKWDMNQGALVFSSLEEILSYDALYRQ